MVMRAIVVSLLMTGCGLVVGLRTDYELSDAASDGGGDADSASTMDSCVGTCCNMMQDGNETDTDCGGSGCRKCDVGKKCVNNGDCLSNKCHQQMKICQ
jgi:hypothetical protein